VVEEEEYIRLLASSLEKEREKREKEKKVREAGGAKRRLLCFIFLRTRYARPIINKPSHAHHRRWG